MAFTIRKVCYFYTTVEDKPGEAFKLLSSLSEIGVNLLAFTAVPIGPRRTQISLFPEDDCQMKDEAQKAGIKLDGPHQALLVQGDDQLGALAEIHSKLYNADVNVYASNGVTDGRGSYGYLIYTRPQDHDRAIAALDIK